MYIVVLFLIIIGTIVELFLKKNIKLYFYFVITILSLMLLFRYGQGQDYFGYKYLFYVTPSSFARTLAVYQNYHGEIGWFILMTIFKMLGLKFMHLIFFSSSLTLIILYRAIRKTPYRFLALLILYPTYYLTYCFSAIRQGIVLAVFLGVLLPLIVENKRKTIYYVICILLCTVHKTAVILFALPLVLHLIKKLKKKELYLISLICILLVNVFILINNSYHFVNISDYLEINISLLAILNRIIYFVIISILHSKNMYKENKMENILYYLYSFGFVIYISTMSLAILSQRLTMPLKSIEILLIPIEIKLFMEDNKKNSLLLVNKIEISKQTFYTIISLFLISIPIIETVKNMNSYIEQGDYYPDINILSYPYISYFNQNDIYKYRQQSIYEIIINKDKEKNENFTK